MLGVNSTLDLFPFLQPEHAFYEPLQHLKNQLIATPRFQEVTRRLARGEETQVRISMKAHPKANFQWRLKGFYLSLQFNEMSASSPFEASTFVCSAKKGSIETFDFPHDPTLLTLNSILKNRLLQGEPDCTVDVLRYYPGKRLTFRQTAGGPGTPRVIGKVVPGTVVQTAYDKLLKVSETVSVSQPIFSVAAPKGIDAANSVFFQEERPGTPLARLINKDNYRQLLFDVGQIHRQLHVMSVPGLSQFDFDLFLRNIGIAIEWISFCRPEARPLLNSVRELLFHHPPTIDRSQFVFCHGDFSCLQILKSNGSYSVIDFDDCLQGDPYLEIARLLTFLKYDIPMFRTRFIAEGQTLTELEEACNAYLFGYQEGFSQGIDQGRLLWLRICCEIQYLFRLFRRNLFHPLAYERTIKLIGNMSKQFSVEMGEGFECRHTLR